ncbi:MAG TPA: nucleotide exchange factor GrpE [Gemmatimonadaceae bacterium]|nr:nucleotide exchange factor GrpE [Gemmatimonadaceae bacterium]
MSDPELSDRLADELTGAQTAPLTAEDDFADDLAAEKTEELDAQDQQATARITQLERELTIERDKHLRLVAEFDNYRKRMMKQASEAEARGQADLVKAILDPLDDIARFAHVDPAVTDSTTLVEGVEMVEKKMAKALRSAGLEIVNPINERFDPSMHEAVATEAAESEDDDGTVARVYQVGHTFNGQLLRPARVVVRQHHGAH